jgi:branched-subunit amino acid aminotransferase/4-amino-4-deoxychorismate lyase
MELSMYSMDEVLGAYEVRKAELEKSSNPLAKGIAYVEGELVPLAEARMPLMDQGFMHSDLTYDVPAVWDGRYFRLDDHLDRFEASCEKLRLRNPLDRAATRALLVDMVAKTGIRDAFVEIIVTRGLQYVRDYKTAENRLYVMVMPYVWALPPELHRGGSSAIVTRTVRRTPPGAVDPTVKNLQWGDFIRGVLEAIDRDARYPFLSDGDGNLTEGAGYNIFSVKDGVLMTPIRGVLQGITRKTVLELAAAKGMKTLVDHIPIDALYHADEIFMCTTAGGIMPISQLDGRPVGGGQVGPITREIWESYWGSHYDPKYSFEIKYP